MKKLTFADLTPEFLIELKALKSVEEIVGACAKKAGRSLLWPQPNFWTSSGRPSS